MMLGNNQLNRLRKFIKWLTSTKICVKIDMDSNIILKKDKMFVFIFVSWTAPFPLETPLWPHLAALSWIFWGSSRSSSWAASSGGWLSWSERLSASPTSHCGGGALTVLFFLKLLIQVLDGSTRRNCRCALLLGCSGNRPHRQGLCRDRSSYISFCITFFIELGERFTQSLY